MQFKLWRRIVLHLTSGKSELRELDEGPMLSLESVPIRAGKKIPPVRSGESRLERAPIGSSLIPPLGPFYELDGDDQSDCKGNRGVAMRCKAIGVASA